MSDHPTPRAGTGGRYELRAKIGEGGSGAVFKAWDTQLQRFVAFKRLKSHDLGNESDIILKEAMTLASIQHPNILTVFDCGSDEEGAFIVTEFLEGESLEDHVARNRYNARTVCDLIAQTLEGLIAAHHVHVIHRDLKPSNIMVLALPSGAWQYKILDFGLARFITRPTTQTMYDDRTVYGTIYYFAPEQIKRQPLDERTDLYAMGCVYYFALTGEQAFQGDSIADVITAHLEHRFKPLREARPDLPEDLCTWITRLMAPNAADRPASAKEALDQFRPVMMRLNHAGTMRITASQVRPAADNLTRPIQVEPIARGRKGWKPVLALALALAAAFVGLTLWPRPPAPAPAAPVAPSVEPPPSVSAPSSIEMPDYFADMERPDLLHGYFDRIKDLPYEYGKVGSVGEALSLVLLRDRYAGDPNIECLQGLHYEGRDGTTAGELDIVVWRKDTKKAVAVYEIKVSDSLESALSKGRSQIRRFQSFIQNGTITRFHYPVDDSRVFRPDQFDSIETYGFIGSRGAAAAGYDIELDLTRAEATQLQKALLRYQQWRKQSSQFRGSQRRNGHFAQSGFARQCRLPTATSSAWYSLNNAASRGSDAVKSSATAA